MANRTVKDAKVVHGTNPQYLVEKIIRTRIYESRYWKEDCFGLSAADVLEKAISLKYIGGIYGGNIKPTPFLSLTLKLLQIQPDKDIIIAFIGRFGERYKYLRALGAFYFRLTATSLEIWKYLEPLYNDMRKLRNMDRMGNFSTTHVDEFVDMLLREERVFDVILPRISKRKVHEDANELEPRISSIEQDLEEEDSDDSEDEREIQTKLRQSRMEAEMKQKSKEDNNYDEGNHRNKTKRSESPDRNRRRRPYSRDRDDRRRKSRSSSPERRKDHRRRRSSSRSPVSTFDRSRMSPSNPRRKRTPERRRRH